MSMPGFTAEASLPEKMEHYRMAGARGTNRGKVVPQLRVCWRVCEGSECRWKCVGELER
jgi:hypothetical protein